MENKDVTQLKIELLPGKVAPRYSTKDEDLKIDKVVITEKGTESELPLVDFQLSDDDGNIYYAVLTGRIVNMISAAIRGVNLRNHSTENP